MKITTLFTAALMGMTAASAVAEQLISDNLNVVGNVCLGDECSAGDADAAPYDGVIIKATTPKIIFDSGNSIGFSDWTVTGSATNGGAKDFSVSATRTGGTSTPFLIKGLAPTSAFIIGDSGSIGLGTTFPTHDLHIVDGAGAEIRLEQDTSGGFSPHVWDLTAGDAGFLLSDVGLVFSTVPFRVENGAANSALILASNGNIGMGPSAAVPDATLHIARNSGDTQVKIEEISGTQTARALVNLVNNGRPDIVMANTGTGKEWAFGAGSNFVLKTGAVGSTDAEKTLHLKLFGATGNMEITGQIITGGGTCGGGCDRVFSPDYKLPSIAKHAEEMFAKGYLPNVGPTVENQPINVSDKLGRMLNELEHAHIYIAEQERKLVSYAAQVAGQDAVIRELSARLAKVEKQLGAEQ